VETVSLPPASTEFSAGPQNLTTVELERFGLGVVTRHLRVAGVRMASPLNRVYCLFCGIAIDHEVGGAEWWFCRNDCNAPDGQ
jgi:hypothetical protein